MITCKFHGQLGNNMFELAALLALAEKTGFEPKIPDFVDRNTLFLYNIQEAAHPRDLEFKDAFEYKFEYLTDEDLHQPEHGWKLYNAPDHNGTADFTFKEIPQQDSMYIVGYFQSEKYFENIKDKLRDEYFAPSKKALDLIEEKYTDKSFLENSLSIHYRRAGDRHKKDMQEYHTDVSFEYYQKAVDHVLKNKKINNLVIFSDDIEWCKSNVSNLYNGDPAFDIHFIEDNTNYVDMFLMSMCKHNIIGNSTFSWWSGWFNRNKDKIVVAPATEWFGRKLSHLDLKDLFPADWKTF